MNEKPCVREHQPNALKHSNSFKNVKIDKNEFAFLRTNTIKFGRVWRYNKLNKSEEERRRADDLHGNV